MEREALLYHPNYLEAGRATKVIHKDAKAEYYFTHKYSSMHVQDLFLRSQYISVHLWL